VFSFAHRKENGSSPDRIIVRRALILFGLGLFLNTYPIFHLSTLRIPGVLQRIALCYFFTSLIVLNSSRKGQIYWLAGLLASYWLMMRYIVSVLGTPPCKYIRVQP
jgi:predicted acyltransferase